MILLFRSLKLVEIRKQTNKSNTAVSLIHYAKIQFAHQATGISGSDFLKKATPRLQL